MAQHFVSEGRCQFCHSTAGNVEHMIAGDSGFICNACVVKEFLRRIAQHHLDSDAQDNVTRATAEAALHEMLFSGGTLNTRLLGGEAVSNEAPGPSA